MPETYDPQKDLLNPNAPKKTPGPAQSQPDMGGGAPAAIASPSTVDTGVPPPAAAPPPAQPSAQPPASIETVSLQPAPAPLAAPAAAPAGGVSPQQAMQQAAAAFQAKHGRAPTQDEQNALTQQAQAMGYTGGNVPQHILDAVLQSIGTPAPTTASTSEQANRRLAELLELDFGEVDPNSQAIQQPLGAFRSAQSRATDRARMAMALRNQAQGIDPSSGAAEAGLLGLLEEQGQNEASFESNLYAQELSEQRETLQEAITLATQAGQQDKARQLQEELGKLDIKLRSLLGHGQLALGQRSLDQDDQQFLERMGFNYAQLKAMMDKAAIEAFL